MSTHDAPHRLRPHPQVGSHAAAPPAPAGELAFAPVGALVTAGEPAAAPPPAGPLSPPSLCPGKRLISPSAQLERRTPTPVTSSAAKRRRRAIARVMASAPAGPRRDERGSGAA